jgi:hypothetical protein
MVPRSVPLTVLLVIGAAGCTAGSDPPGNAGYVLLDREARASGRITQGDFEGAPLLPVALDTAEPVAFSSSVGREVFELRAGMLAHVHGAAGAVEWLRLRDDVSDDRLRVRASREVAADLARRVAGQVEGGEGGVFTIVAPDVFDRSSFLKPPDGIAEVLPDARIAEGIARTAVLGEVTLPAAEGERQAAFVGVFTSDKGALILDAAGGFTLEDACSGDLLGRGRYRVSGDRVVLESESAPMVLEREGGVLLDPSGVRFAPLVIEEPVALPAEKEEEP